ncbi:MAG: carbohydrate porin [Phycisphaerales bacterium]|nr:carbohydrate porin [Phycisphaerales bacterium]
MLATLSISALLVVGHVQVQESQPKPVGADEKLGAGASEMIEPEARPIESADGSGTGKGLKEPKDVPFSMRTHVRKGAERRQGNTLRSLAAAGGSSNKVLPRTLDFNTPGTDVVLDIELTKPLDDLTLAARALSEEVLGASFTPAVAMTWQRATKVLPGAPHGKGLIWYGADGELRLWNTDEGIGSVVYNLQGNAGVGSPFQPIMGQNVGNPLANNNIIISTNFGLYMLYWQQSFLESRLRLRVGKMEGQVFFDRNAIAYDPIGGFLAQNFNQSSSIPFPSYGFGGVLSYDIEHNLTIRGGLYNSSSRGTTAGFDGMSAENLFGIVELDRRSWVPWGETAREGHQRLMVWHKGIDDWETGQGSVSGWGVALNIDQAVADTIAVFMRVGYGSQSVAPTSLAVSAGFAVMDALPMTDMGLAVGWSSVTDYGRFASGVAAEEGDQLLIEWYARVHLAPSLHVGPVVQFVRDPSAGIDTSVIYGVRANWSF